MSSPWRQSRKLQNSNYPRRCERSDYGRVHRVLTWCRSCLQGTLTEEAGKHPQFGVWSGSGARFSVVYSHTHTHTHTHTHAPPALAALALVVHQYLRLWWTRWAPWEGEAEVLLQGLWGRGAGGQGGAGGGDRVWRGDLCKGASGAACLELRSCGRWAREGIFKGQRT